MASHERDDPTKQELRDRIANAKSVLRDAPGMRAIRKATEALEGASLEELAADQDFSEEPPPGSAEYLRAWQDGYDTGYAAATERYGSAA